jgi:hypothetical protein
MTLQVQVPGTGVGVAFIPGEFIKHIKIVEKKATQQPIRGRISLAPPGKTDRHVVLKWHSKSQPGP